MPSATEIAAAALKSSTKPAFATKAKLVTHVDKDKRKDVILALHQATLNIIAPKGNKVETSLHILDVTAMNAVAHSNEQVNEAGIKWSSERRDELGIEGWHDVAFRLMGG